MSETSASYTLDYENKPAIRRALRHAGKRVAHESTYTAPYPSLVKALFEITPWTQQRFAEELSVDVSTLRRWSTDSDYAMHRQIPYASWHIALLKTGYAPMESFCRVQLGD